MKCLLYSVWICLLITNLSAAPIDEVLETTTESAKDAQKLVTKRHILQNFNQNMLHTVGASGGNRPFFNWFSNHQNNNNVGMTNPPNRPFVGLFGGLGNRPFLAALQAQQAQAASVQVQGQGIPALQDDVEGLGVPQDMQTLQNVQNMASLQGLQGLQGFHPFQSFQSHLPFHGTHQGMNRPFGGGAGIFTHLPFGMGNHHAGLPVSVAPAYTELGKQAPEFSYDPYGFQYFAPTGFPNY